MILLSIKNTVKFVTNNNTNQMFKYGIDSLTVDKVIAIANSELKAVLTSEAIDKINKCRAK